MICHCDAPSARQPSASADSPGHSTQSLSHLNRINMPRPAKYEHRARRQKDHQHYRLAARHEGNPRQVDQEHSRKGRPPQVVFAMACERLLTQGEPQPFLTPIRNTCISGCAPPER